MPNKEKMKSLNYRNFIYLFNSPNEIVVSQDSSDQMGKIGSYFVSQPSQDSIAAYEFVGSNKIGSSGQLKIVGAGATVFKDTDSFGDFPKLYPPQSVNEGLRVKATAFDNPENPATLLNIGGKHDGYTVADGYFKVTNDFGYSPKVRHQIQNVAGIYKYTFSPDGDYNSLSEPKLPYTYLINFFSNELNGASINDMNSLLGETTSEIAVSNLLTNKLWVEANKGIIDIGIKKANQSEPFSYTQNMYFQVKRDTIDNFENFITKFSGEFAKITLNASTRIGVPYDIQEAYVLSGDVVSSLDNYSIKNPVPKYENVYNYYDPQFENAAIDLISNEVLDETVLPSVYDFLYLNYQPELISTLVDIAGDNINMKDTTISNLNSYLDSLSSLYNKYTNGYLASVGGDSNFQDSGFDPLGFETLNQLPGYNSNLVSEVAPSGLPSKTAKQQVLTEILNSENYREMLKERKNNSIPKWLEEMKRGIYFSEKSIDTFNEAIGSANAFPFAMKISIPQEDVGPLARLLSEAELLDSINTHAASLITPYNQTELPGALFSNVKSYANFYGALLSNPDIDTLSAEKTGLNLYQEIKLKTFKMHFENKLPNIGPSIYTGIDYENVDLFLDSFEDINLQSPKNVLIYSQEETQEATTGLLDLLSKLKSAKFFKKLEEELIDGLMRTPLDIQNGEFAHEETLMYEIAKYEIVGDEESNYIQSIFLPITNQNILEYLDTQVIPYKDYYYKIFAHKVIVGTAYGAADFTSTEPDDFFTGYITAYQDHTLPYDSWSIKKHNYEIKPYLQFIRIPYYNVPLVNIKTDKLNFSRIEDFPPLPPQVQVIPYKNINNKVLFLFNNSSGELKDSYTKISQADEAAHEAVRTSQKTFNIVTFKSDDVPRTYQVFRMEKRPKNYIEFSTDDTAISFSLESIAETSFLDTISPNKDYYYTFRAIDVHGKLSNPTIIYKIRMVDGIDSAPYLTIETLDGSDLKKEAKKEKLSYTKTFQKYLLFGLNNEQNEVEYPDVELTDTEKAIGNYQTTPVDIYSDTDFSGANSALLEPKYKIRITSKQTGRKIDININFKNAKNIINDV